MLGLSRVARRVKLNVGNLGIRKTSSSGSDTLDHETESTLLPTIPSGGSSAGGVRTFMTVQTLLYIIECQWS